ncbi:hypothetical protein G6321_00053630 [Bradyrhizobium barranii subsp. barranii]|uniref:Cytochrome c domain-containing protein n=1 Tax=Bradyrhizobium barranii subsp. barranii TaxID=2823807 RepID=A0A7Z0Q8A0_9BRAD|nr:cytochrome P460 family protein [Bradyrhizobium barranii]UGX94285.1 hypothetical protein G6321_00053630 [Bradyrhizobium barranii subsp. barranii]
MIFGSLLLKNSKHDFATEAASAFLMNRWLIFPILSLALFIPSVTECHSRALRAPAEAATCNTPTTPFCDALMPPPIGWNGPVFNLSQNYPANPGNEPKPWEQFQPDSQPAQYLAAVLNYFFEGNIRPSVEASFDTSLNPVRKWYHVPWQDFGANGREFIHGLTRERSSRPGELHPNQSQLWTNYAVGFYNAPGGFAIGRVWTNHDAPNASLANMPEGTVAAKLLFTTAPVNEVPYLQGAPEWTGYIYRDVHNDRPQITFPRSPLKLRLLQVDLAVKDDRVANTTGWVFGTYVYGGGIDGSPGQGWNNVRPVGLMWGNDPNYSSTWSLTETKINPTVRLPHYGYQGRLNGPVDNPISSCLSCHATAQKPPGMMFPPAGSDPSRWFQNYKSGQPFDTGGISTDYSLQLSVGIANFEASKAIPPASSPTAVRQLRERLNRYSVPPRDGGLIH